MIRIGRKGNRSSRLGALSLALLVALCVTGIGYAAWTDELTIDGTTNLGYVEVVLSPGGCSDPQISCSVGPADTLVVTLTNAQPGTHTCAFTITNAGTIPVKIQAIDIMGVPAGVEVYVEGVAKGTQIEQSGVHPDSVSGAVRVVVLEGCIASCSIEIAFSFVQWNMYVA